MREIQRIIVHCSASNWGSAAEIDRWHKKRGWNGIGYHYVICNGRAGSQDKYQKTQDGAIQRGREDAVQGAHVKGHNEDSIGICLIGEEAFTQTQLFTRLPKLLSQLLDKYGLTTADIYGHNELDNKKTCPNLDMDQYRDFIEITRSPYPNPRPVKE